MNSASDVYFAKTIVFGDVGTGRSTLIYNLDFYKPPQAQTTKQYNDHFYIPLELSSFELENNRDEVAALKIWKYSNHLSKRDEENACHAALFSIIVFNITNAESFKNVFEKWIPLREKLCPDSFLYIVGTHSDHSQLREVEITEICKQCAKKDAIYTEISNQYGTNIPLLRKLLCIRVSYILQRREELIGRPFQPKFLEGYNTSSTPGNGNRGHDENKSMESNPTNVSSARRLSLTNKSTDFLTTNNNNNTNNNTNNTTQSQTNNMLLESSMILNSQNIGTIYASLLEGDIWQGYEQHEEELHTLAVQIDTLIDNLAKTIEQPQFDIHAFPVSEVLHFQPTVKPSQEVTAEARDCLEEDIQQLQEAFHILGLHLPPLPNVPMTSLAPLGSSNNTNNNTNANANALASSGNTNNTTAANNSPNPANNNTNNNNNNTALSDSYQLPPPPAMNNNLISGGNNLRKMMIKLPAPTSRSVEMILDLDLLLDQQVDMFLMTYHLSQDQEIRKKLMMMFSKIQKEYFEAANNSVGGNRSRTLSKTSTIASTNNTMR